jgi:thiamine-monophosphate kinase
VTVRDLGEERVVEILREAFASACPKPTWTGIGDDCAVIDGAACALLTTDALVSGVHFDPARAPARFVGRKAIAVNASDVAAMGGLPRAALLSLVLPAALPQSWLRAFARGVAERSRELGIAIVGGNVSAGADFVASVTVVGEASTRVVHRSGGRAGDRLYVAGTLGGAARGVELLAAREGADAFAVDDWADGAQDPCVMAQLDPTPRVREGVLAARFASAMIDVSDGLALDASRLCSASGCGAEIDVAALPISSGAGIGHALSGGEDYALLVAIPQDAAMALETAAHSEGLSFVCVGRLVAEQGVWRCDPDGRRAAVAPSGYTHFKR